LLSAPLANEQSEHLQALIDCIKELHTEGKQLQQEYEEATIEGCRVKNKFRDYKRKQTKDIVNTVNLFFY